MRQTAYRQRVRSLLPHHVQEAIRAQCGDVRNDAQEVVGFRNDCELGLDGATLRSAAQRLQRDPAVLDDLAYQFSALVAARANLRGDIVFLNGAIAALHPPGRE